MLEIKNYIEKTNLMVLNHTRLLELFLPALLVSAAAASAGIFREPFRHFGVVNQGLH